MEWLFQGYPADFQQSAAQQLLKYVLSQKVNGLIICYTSQSL